MKKIIKHWPLILAVAGAFLIGLFIGNGDSTAKVEGHRVHEHEVEQIWTCSMHPQIRQPKPGKCPICAMDLVPVSSLGGQEETGVRELKLSPRAIKLAEIQVKPVERRYVSAVILMVGKVEYDETRVKYITSRVPGRIDRLYVDYTGMQVRKGDHLVSLYSPELITAQQELLQALSFKSRTVESVREKLRLWGLTPAQIKEIEKSKKPKEHLTIYSPMSGVVVHRNAAEGQYVSTGTRIYTIADLSRVWIKIDAYESDVTWLRYGQTVTFETEAYPGEMFEGKISFIAPVLDPKTRTVKIRVNVPNPKLKLKPEMFVRARVRSKLSASGKVLNPDLVGKWISPMHPEIVKNRPGKCDICGMPLVRAEELGYLSPGEVDKEVPLVIPASTPLLTGKRAVVYVKVPGKEGTFAGKEVVLGPRAGQYYIVKEGLEEGEEVVVNGAFKIDSDLQIQAKPSMMSPEGGAPAPGHHHHDEPGQLENHSAQETRDKQTRKGVAGAAAGIKVSPGFRDSIDAVADAYFDIQHALSSDNLDKTRAAGKKLLEKLARVDMKLLTGQAHMDWMDLEKKISTSAQGLAKAGDIEVARKQFEHVTAPITAAVKRFGSGKTAVYRFHCPMAFNNKGAYWLQNRQETRNPYFGAAMLLCKDKVETLVPDKKK